MKIVHLCLTSIFDTALAYQDNLLPKYQRLAGHDVTVVATVYQKTDPHSGRMLKSALETETTAEGVKVLRLSPWLPELLNRRLHLFRGVRRTLELEHPDLIFVHDLSSVSYLVLSTYHRRHPAVHIVFDNHGDRYNSCRNRLSFLYTRYLYRWCVTRRLARIGERFYGVTPGRCDFLRDIYGISENKIALLPMGADDIALDEALDGGWRERIRERYGIAPDDFLVVTGGKIDRRKNIHLLAQAVYDSPVKKLKLLVFGTVSEELRPLFERMDGTKVLMAGWVPSGEVYRYFIAADLVCFPGLHSVLWEQALACRVPCAFTRLEGFGHAYVPGTIPMEEGTAEYYRQLLEPLADGSRQYAGFKQAAAGSERDMFRYSRIARKVEYDVTGK